MGPPKNWITDDDRVDGRDDVPLQVRGLPPLLSSPAPAGGPESASNAVHRAAQSIPASGRF